MLAGACPPDQTALALHHANRVSAFILLVQLVLLIKQRGASNEAQATRRLFPYFLTLQGEFTSHYLSDDGGTSNSSLYRKLE